MQSQFLSRCEQCKKSHKKCDRVYPTCSRCSSRNVQCVYEVPTTSRKRKATSSVQPSPTTSQRKEARQHRNEPLVVATTQSAHHDLSTSEILDACFQLTDISSDERLKQQITASVLWNNSFVDREITISATEVDSRIRQASWFAMMATVLNCLPSAQTPSNYFDIRNQIEYCASLSQILFQFDFGPVLQLSPALLKLTELSRKQLKRNAASMYSASRDILMSPLIYHRIASNHNLAQTCALLVAYLLTEGDRPEEAELLINSEKVYLKKNRKIMNASLANYTGTDLQQMTLQMLTTQHIIMLHSCMKSVLWFNSTPLDPENYNSETVQKLLNSFDGLFDMKLCPPPLEAFLKEVKSQIAVIRSAIDHEASIQKVQSVLDTCRILRMMNYSSGIPRILVTLWNVMSLILSIAVTLVEKFNMNETLQFELFEEQYHLATDITMDFFNNLPIITATGPEIFSVLLFAIDTHIEYYDVVSKPNVPGSTISQYLAYMNTDSIILDSIIQTHQTQHIKDITTRLSLHIKQALQNLSSTTQSTSPTQQYTSTSESPNSNSMISDFDVTQPAPSDDTSFSFDSLPLDEFFF